MTGRLGYVRIFLVPVLFILMVIEGHAAEREVSLREAVKVAMEGNPEIRASRSSLGAQKADVGIARSYMLPRFSLEERATRTNNPTGVFSTKLNQERFSQSDFAINKLNNPDAVGDFQTLVSVEQPIFVMNSLIGLAMARKEYLAGSDEYQRKKEEITFRVAQAYLRICTAKARQDVARKGLEDSKEHLRISEVRYKNGLGQYSDVLRARTALAESEQRLVSAEKDVSVAKRWLGLLMGLTEPVDVSDGDSNIPLMGIDYYSDSSLSRRDISALDMRHQAAKDEIKRAESLYLPTVGIGGSYQLNDHGKPFGSEGESWNIMAVLRWTIFDGTSREFQRIKAQEKAAETAEHLNGLKQLVSFRIHEAYLGIEEARKNEELAKSALATAEEGKRLVKARYENSLSPIVDLLDVQFNLERVREGLISRQNEYRAAVLNLSYESGTILKDLSIEQ